MRFVDESNYFQSYQALRLYHVYGEKSNFSEP